MDFMKFHMKVISQSNGHVIIGQTLANRLGKDIDDELTLLSPIDQVFGLGFPPYEKNENIGYFFNKSIEL